MQRAEAGHAQAMPKQRDVSVYIYRYTHMYIFIFYPVENSRFPILRDLGVPVSSWYSEKNYF